VITQSVSTRYPLASLGTVRPGTIGLQFSTAGAAVFTTEAGDICTMTAVAGQSIETGPLATVTTLPASTLGIVGR
jgi:hypothetical protein